MYPEPPKRNTLYDAVVSSIFGAGAGLVLSEFIVNHVAHEIAKTGQGSQWYEAPIWTAAIGAVHGGLFGNHHDLSHWWTVLCYGVGAMTIINNGLHLDCGDIHPSKTGLTTLAGIAVMYGSSWLRR